MKLRKRFVTALVITILFVLSLGQLHLLFNHIGMNIYFSLPSIGKGDELFAVVKWLTLASLSDQDYADPLINLSVIEFADLNNGANAIKYIEQASEIEPDNLYFKYLKFRYVFYMMRSVDGGVYTWKGREILSDLIAQMNAVDSSAFHSVYCTIFWDEYLGHYNRGWQRSKYLRPYLSYEFIDKLYDEIGKKYLNLLLDVMPVELLAHVYYRCDEVNGVPQPSYSFTSDDKRTESEFYYYFSSCFATLKTMPEYDRLINLALEIDTTNVHAMIGLASKYLHNHEWEKAREILAKAIQYDDPYTDWAKELYGNIEDIKADYEVR